MTIFRAVYRRCEEIHWEDNAPLEKFIKSLLLDVSFWPMTQEDVESVLEQSGSDWRQRDEAARVVQEELNETRRLRRARRRDLPAEGDFSAYVLNETDSTGNLARAIWMSRDQYHDLKKMLLDQGCEVVEENAHANAAGGVK